MAPKYAAGCIFRDPEGNILLLKRSPLEKNYAGHWALPGGGSEEGETPEDTARRESREEIGWEPQDMEKVDEVKTPSGLIFHTFASQVPERFETKLNSEHVGSGWFKPSALPDPMHPAVSDTIRKLEMAKDAEFNESDHPRNGDGTFGSGSGTIKDKHGKAYSVKHQLDHSGRHEYQVEDPENPNNGYGGHVAGATLRKDGTAISFVMTRSPYQRKGVASALYDHIGRHQGKPLTPNKTLTDEGEAFWKTRLAKTAQDKAMMANDHFAFDKSTIRRVDDDGHMHVEMTPISKANVCPYYGREIPEAERLGLDMNKVYRMFRHPDELKKAAPSFSGKPLLTDHIPVSAESHPKQKTVGAVGNEVVWKDPYLMAPLSIWDKDAIEGVKDGSQKELSSAYRYDADMTPGTYNGEAYDGVMRNLVANHVALVKSGRAGSDVMVGDSKMKLNFRAQFALDAKIAAHGKPPLKKHNSLRAERDSSKEHRAKNPDKYKQGGDGEFSSDAANGAFSEADKEAASSKVAHREGMPESAFLEPASRKYPVKEKKNGEWKYDRDLLLAAARRARMQKDESLAARADAIRKREFGTAQDSKPKESRMARKHPTVMAALLQGALMAHLSPRLAMDEKVDLAPVIKGVTKKNFDADVIATRVTKVVGDKLALDADLSDLTELLDALHDSAPDEAADSMEPSSGVPNAGKVRGMDESKVEGLRDKIPGAMDMSDEDWGSLKTHIMKCATNDEVPEELEGEAQDEELDEDGKPIKAQDEEEDDMPPVKKQAMDAAISAAVTKERENGRQIEAAKEEVRAYVGKLPMAFDSAADVYKAALTAMKVNTKDVHPSAFRAILQAQPKPGRVQTPAPLAMDAKAANGFAERHPGAASVRHV